MRCNNLREALQAGGDARTGTNEDKRATPLPKREERSILLKWVSLVAAQRAALTPTLVVMMSWLENYCLHGLHKGDEFCHIRGAGEWKCEIFRPPQARGGQKIRQEFINPAPSL